MITYILIKKYGNERAFDFMVYWIVTPFMLRSIILKFVYLWKINDRKKLRRELLMFGVFMLVAGVFILIGMINKS